MKKTEVAWVLIRILSLYLIWRGVESCIVLVVSFLTVVTAARTNPNLPVNFAVLIDPIVRFVFYFSVGVDTLKNDNGFDRLINRRPSRE